MSSDPSDRRPRGWLAPRTGGYTFRERTGRRGKVLPPTGSAGVGNFDRARAER